MFSGDPRPVVHDEASYMANRRHLEELQKALDNANALNEQGKRNFEQLTSELQRKVQEGDKAREMLAALQSSRPRLTYNDPAQEASFFVQNLPTHLSPTPSARIEEVQSPNAHRSGSSYQTHPRHPSGLQNEQFWPKQYQTVEQTPGAGPSTVFGGIPQSQQQPFFGPRPTPQPQVSQSHFQTQANAYHQQPNSGQQTQQRQSSTAASHYRPSPTPSYPPQNTNASQLNVSRPSSTPQPQQATSQSNSTQHPQPAQYGSTPQSNSTQHPQQQHSQQKINQTQAQPTWPQQATVNPQQLQLHSSSRTSQPREQPVVAPRPSVPPIPNAQTGATSQRVSQPSAPPISNAQPGATSQRISQPAAAAAPRTDGRQPSVPSTQNAQSRPPAPMTPSNSAPAQPRPPAAANPLLRPNPLFQLDPSRKSSTPSAPAPVPAPATATAPAPTPSYGISPFAHNPAPKPQHVVSNPPGPVPPTASAFAANNSLEAMGVFLKLINTWQKAAPPQAYMDIPHANIRIKKLPSGEIHFFGPDSTTKQQVRLSPTGAFKRLRFQGTVAIFVSPAGVSELLQIPVSEKVKASHKQFSGVAAKDAPEAEFSNPPPPLTLPQGLVNANTQPLPNGGAPRMRTPKDADKRFLAHDILRALGKTPADDDRVRYAKRRALEAPLQKEPLVLQRISSNEPSAKSTSSASQSGSPSPPPSPPPAVARSVPQRVPLFLPSDADSPAAPSPLVRARARPRSTLPGMYVLVPPAPSYVKRDLEKRAQRRQQEQEMAADDAAMDVAVPEDVAMPEVSEAEEPSEPDIDVLELKRRRALGMYQNTENDEEAAAMLEACTRLREVQCRWFACGSFLNSVENLVTHLHEIHAQEDQDLTTCMWDICGESFPSSTQLALHAETHVLGTIPCPYEDCGQIFSSPRELVAHNSLGHAEQSEQNSGEPVRPRALLRSSRLNAPDEATLVTPPVPESIPTWEARYLAQECMSPGVQIPVISMERHAALGPWVLANICAPTTKLRARRYNAALPLKYQPDYEFIGVSSKHYSFLSSQPARVRDLAELDSHTLTEMLRTGEFVLWPPEGQFQLKDEVEEGSTASTVVEKVPGSAGVLEKAFDVDEESVGNRQPSLAAEIVPYQSVGDKTDEEIAVEDMLQERDV